jgi:TRAP-type C4-dicarboxylate transport system permease small subunit
MRMLPRLLRMVLKTIMVTVMFLLVTVTFVDVGGRYLFSRPLPGAFEWQEVLMAIAIFTGLPLVTIDREHVTVSLLDGIFARWAILRRLQLIVVNTVSCGVLTFVALRLYDQGQGFIRWGDTSAFMRIPYWPVAYFMAAMAALAAVVLAIRVALLAAGGEMDNETSDGGGF